MTLDPANYPRSQTHDARSALALALARLLGGLSFTGPASASPWKLRAVYATWAQFSAKSATGALPIAAVLPDRASYSPAGATPRLLDDTWWTDGSDGWGLYETARLTTKFVVAIRAGSEPERASIIRAMEAELAATGAPSDRPRLPLRYGRSLPLPEYWGLSGRVWLDALVLLDSEPTVAANRWEAQAELSAEGPVCRLIRTPALSPRVRLLDMPTDQPIER